MEHKNPEPIDNAGYTKKQKAIIFGLFPMLCSICLAGKKPGFFGSKSELQKRVEQVISEDEKLTVKNYKNKGQKLIDIENRTQRLIDAIQIELLSAIDIPKLRSAYESMDEDVHDTEQSMTKADFLDLIETYGFEDQKKWAKGRKAEEEKEHKQYAKEYHPNLTFDPVKSTKTLKLIYGDEKKLIPEDPTDLWVELTKAITNTPKDKLDRIIVRISITNPDYSQKDFIDAVAMYGSREQNEWATQSKNELDRLLAEANRVGPTPKRA